MSTQPSSTFKIWIQAFRPFSYTASIIPAMLGAGLAIYRDAPAQWWLLPLIVFASMLIQAGTNLVSEYFDYKKGVDRPETYGSSRVLVEQLLRPHQILIAGLICFALTIGLGLYFIALRGWIIFIIGFVGVLGGLFYTADPFGYKYLGVGDLFVFLLMGPLMVIGSYFVLTGAYDRSILLISIPVGFLVAAILSGNNLRDIQFDLQAHIHTTASVLGHRIARWEYSLLVAGAYIATIIMIVLKILPLWSLLTLLTIPPAVKVIRAALQSRPDHPETIATLDVQTAQLHMPFGLLLIVSVILGGLL